MCVFSGPRAAAAAPMQMASTDNREAMRQADIEARLRRRRAGAAANILTGPRGIPQARRMGEVVA